MTVIEVKFEYITGLKRPLFRNARLTGNWDQNGRLSESWIETPMAETTAMDGCPVFTASVQFSSEDVGRPFRWGVVLDNSEVSNFWGIPTEIADSNSAQRYLYFSIQSGSSSQRTQKYYLTHCRRLGANKIQPSGGGSLALHFGVWAPNAESVSVVFADPSAGYIDDQGNGIDPGRQPLALTRSSGGIWEGNSSGTYQGFIGVPYMYRIKNKQGHEVYRTDIFSRSQAGRGDQKPPNWNRDPATLDGLVSCSVIVDPDVVRQDFSPTVGSPPQLIRVEEFWATEFVNGRPIPTRLEDLIIYELHVGSLGFGRSTAGNLGDAISFLDHLRSLGVNAVELMPMAEFSGSVGWGYGNTHHFCIETSAGGRDEYRHFVRECHRSGIAVIQDVVYNHYSPDAERAEWQYDSALPEENIYYWYEGLSSQYGDGSGGYLDNGSSGFTPRFWEENVRQQFVSGAAFLLEEMHVDGLRVDLTQAIHRDNRLHADGHPVGNANVAGQKFLRQWSRTVHMIKPSAILIAEDHTGWDAVVKTPDQGGLGFQAKWEVDFYHNLIGDSDFSGGKARLLRNAGFGGNDPLELDAFSGVLYNTQHNQVVFPESHDEAGNAQGSARTIVVAVNYAAVIGPTRTVAEARSRVCYGLSLLSAGISMFFMGEEVTAQQAYKFDDFLQHREDIVGLRNGFGKSMFRFFQDLIRTRKTLASIRSHNIDILHQSNDNRVIAFKRWSASDQVIIVASLNKLSI